MITASALGTMLGHFVTIPTIAEKTLVEIMVNASPRLMISNAYVIKATQATTVKTISMNVPKIQTSVRMEGLVSTLWDLFIANVPLVMMVSYVDLL